MPEREGIAIYVAPHPWGKNYKKQQGYGFYRGILSFSENKEATWDRLEFIIRIDGLPGYTNSLDTCTLNNTAVDKQCEFFMMNHGVESSNLPAQLQTLRKLPHNRFDEPHAWVDAIIPPLRVSGWLPYTG